MERLRAMDAAFLGVESEQFPMHGGGMMLFDPSTARDGFGFERYRAFLAERIAHVDRLRRRIVTVTPGLGAPVFVDDPEFDVDHHVCRVLVPAPGGRRELAEAAGALFGSRLDRSRPLWRYYWFEGLADGAIAVLGTWHHALVDGMTAMKVLQTLFDVTPEGRRLPPEVPTVSRSPSVRELLADAALRRPLRAGQDLAALARHVPVRARRVIQAVTAQDAPPLTLPFTAPHTALDAEVTHRRTLAWLSLPLDPVRRARAALGATFNDVFVSVVGGALRQYLLAHGEAPDAPLVGVVPVSIHHIDAAGNILDEGNLISAVFTRLGTDLADPVARTRAVHDAMIRGKEFHRALGTDTVVTLIDHMPQLVLPAVVTAYERLHLGGMLPPAASAIASNVPGSPVPLYAAGARLVASYPFGPLMLTPLNITCITYDGKLDVGVVSCPDVVEDVWQLVELMPAALDALCIAAARVAA